MTWAICSASARMAGARSDVAAMAVPTKIENTTICRISLSARALTIEVGTRWATKSLRVRLAALTEADAASGLGRASPTPGLSRCTISRPMVSDTIEAAMNQPMVLTPTRPMEALSSMWAMPTTRVENTSGPMIILISRRNTSVRMPRPPVMDFMWAGSVTVLFRMKPTTTPAIMANRTRRVKRRFMRGLFEVARRNRRRFDGETGSLDTALHAGSTVRLCLSRRAKGWTPHPVRVRSLSNNRSIGRRP